MSPVTDGVLMAIDVCRYDDLVPELGVAALVNGAQVAIFRLSDGRVYAVSNHCPYSGAAVISRGITGSRGDTPTIASPVYKQVFSLENGTCLDQLNYEPLPGAEPDLVSYPVLVVEGRVIVRVPDEGAFTDGVQRRAG